ncbi:MAG TPA: gamma-glutamyltransferase family protein [Actinomycetota bacterium]|nr:gamma-glutamyltransferase family protein [Actinomycetota bacterium]
MVSSTHWLASATAMAMLERGGTAFDAAVAAGFTLQVVEPHLNGPGGEVPILLYAAADDEVVVIDGQGPAPAAATIDTYRALGLDLIPGTGLLAACVPGAFGAWLLLLERYGTLHLADVLEHAIGYAGGGHPLVPRTSATIAANEQVLREHWPTSGEIYLRDGVPRPGERFANPLLAETFARILRDAQRASDDREGQIEHARRSFYEGFVADAIGSFCATPAWDGMGRDHACLLTSDDMASWGATTEPPASRTFDRYEVYKCGPWTQGPVFLQQLGLLESFDLATMGHNSPDHIHTVVEAAKLAFADREAFYGDPRFVDVPLAALIDASYCAARRRLIDDAASFELRPGSPAGREPRLPPATDRGSSVPAHLHGAGEPTRGDTCHVDVVDRHGNMVAATPSGGWLQSSPAIPGLGFCLGTRAQMFWLIEDLPASLQPRKRPRTTLTPSLAFRDGRPYLAFGTPGGDTQDQWSLSFFLNHVVFDMDLQAAIDAPMFHTNHFPSSFYPRAANPGQVEAESRVGEGVMAELRRRGHEVVDAGPWALGRLCAVGRESDGVLKAAANPRGMQGYAAGR